MYPYHSQGQMNNALPSPNPVRILTFCERKTERETKDNLFTSDTDTVKGETQSNIRGRKRQEKSGEQSSRTQA